MVTYLTVTSDLTPSEKKLFEVVERKGIGHPDTLADGIAEAISIEYSNYCLEHFGIVLHQMLDKILLIGGVGKFGFGVGEIIKPWRIVLNGRLSDSFGAESIPINDIQIKAAKKYLKQVMPRLDLDKGIEFITFTTSYSKNPRWFKPETIDDVPDAKHPYANDTSTCSGYWPLSITERLSLLLEKYFYNQDDSPKYKYIGQDIKVMSVRKKDSIEVTMCIPFFSIDTPDLETYLIRKSKLYQELKDLAEEYVKDQCKIQLFLNTQDNAAIESKKSIGLYFVTSGSALDSGEEGAVGRGNRSRGVISSIRPVNMEAIWGKNPVYYVGKVYSYLADKIAKEIAETLECEANVYISSRNSDDLLKPYNIFVETSKKRSKKQINDIIEHNISLNNWTQDILKNKVFLPAPGSGNGYKSTF